MPWTRLHALKDYADMAAFLARHEAVRATFNVVPTLLDQLQVLGSGEARPDPFLALALKDPAELSFEDSPVVIGLELRSLLAQGVVKLGVSAFDTGDATL